MDSSLLTPPQREFLRSPLLSQPLRITCYGSSSSDTPVAYLQAAQSLGYLLAQRGHTCVNGAGSYGCMAAMNDGVDAGGGHVVGVIHEMWLENNDNDTTTSSVRDGGAHAVFATSIENAASSKEDGKEEKKTTTTQREMLVVSGDDLQERKKLLVKDADGLIVLPGGPGTWDELWEMVCVKGIGLSNLPIVCVNCNGYYDPFREMLLKAWDEGLTKHPPHELVHFVDTAEEAVQWMELPPEKRNQATKPVLLQNSSFLHDPFGVLIGRRNKGSAELGNSLVFVLGLSMGIIVANAYSRRK